MVYYAFHFTGKGGVSGALAWEFFRRTDLHKLSAVDATSFTVIKRARIRLAFTFDHHFAVVGFTMVAQRIIF